MPSEHFLEYEITLARQDLEANLEQLQMVVRQRLDVRARVRRFLTRRHVAIAAGVATLLGLWLGRRRAA